MAAVSLFWDINIAAVKSCENTLYWKSKVRFKRRATAGPNPIDRIKFDFNTAVALRLKPSRANALPCSTASLAVLHGSSSTWF